MSILKKVEKNELSLTDTVVIKKEDINKRFGDLWKDGEGAMFTIEELIEKSLMYSDNTAYEALFRLLTTNEVIEVYDNLEIEVSSKESNPKVSPKSYSSIFRSLYLASYLSKEDSNYILEMLTRTIFKDKIPAGVPADIPVAHKIGVFSIEESTEQVFTDCGIVYAPQRPYVLCIFVKDSDEEAKKHSSYISNMVYKYVQVVKGGNN
jgi:beta-lactamase class A